MAPAAPGRGRRPGMDQAGDGAATAPHQVTTNGGPRSHDPAAFRTRIIVKKVDQPPARRRAQIRTGRMRRDPAPKLERAPGGRRSGGSAQGAARPGAKP
jgi:hypothetical protein